MKSLQFFTHENLRSYLSLRKGEKRVGQYGFIVEEELDELEYFKNRGAQFCLLGVPECIGPLANSGKSGAEFGWPAFLKAFINVQSNRFLSGKEFVLLGQIKVDDLMDQALSLEKNSNYYLQKLHVLCESLDQRVEEAVLAITKAELIPIVIGGGHNNAYPIINAVSSQLKSLNILNIDAHADFRALEGRHSGNGFSYAFQKGNIYKYAVYGLHQNYNSENMLKSMDSEKNISYAFLEDIQYMDELFHNQIEFLKGVQPKGLEIDMDSIRNMPSSAISPSGFSLEQMRYFLRKATKALSPAYLHLAEAAPISEMDQLMVGKALSYLVTDFIKSYQ